MTRITATSIPYGYGKSVVRYFVEVQSGDGRWHDAGNFESKPEAVAFSAAVVATETSWRA